jgi:dipeptidase D
VWRHFASLCRIPRISGHEKALGDHIEEFGRTHALETTVDRAGNIRIRKEATSTAAAHHRICLQAHIDMVGQKEPDTNHDFTRDPIEPTIHAQWVGARNTSLGADNGIGVAAILAVLEGHDIEHGPIEALFTVEEESSMRGALGIDTAFLSADTLLNLDSETEGELYIGCAGGTTTAIDIPFTAETVPTRSGWYRIGVSGATGGHSGIDIHHDRANAIVLLARVLEACARLDGFRVAHIEGGDAHNVIARNAGAYVTVAAHMQQKLLDCIERIRGELCAQYAYTDPALDITAYTAESRTNACTTEATRRIVRALHLCPNGVFSMDPHEPGLVHTSSNIGLIATRGDHGCMHIETLQRSLDDDAKKESAARVAQAFRETGAHVRCTGTYPGWYPDRDSPVCTHVQRVYAGLFGRKARLKTIHAGLECGIIKEKYPHMDMLSFGPTIVGAHSTGEKVYIPSVDAFWHLLCEVLRTY